MAEFEVIDIAIGVVIMILSYFLRGKLKGYDDHVEKCQAQEIRAAGVEAKADALQDDVKSMSGTLQWVGDCILTIGAKMDLSLPDRPKR